MKKRNWLIWAIAGIFVFSSVIPVSAMVVVEPDPEEMAVYLQGNFSAYSTGKVTGDIYSAEGNISVTNSGNAIFGDIYYNQDKSAEVYSGNHGSGALMPLSDTEFTADMPELIDFPEIDNSVDNYLVDWGQTETINADTHAKKLTLRGKLLVDVSRGDISIVADTLSTEWASSIELSGNGRLFLFIGNKNDQVITINNGKNPDKTYIFSKSQLRFKAPDNATYAHLYYSSQWNSQLESISLRGTLFGSVVTDATSLTISGGDNMVNGLVYAPNAETVISNSGNIKGSLVAKSLNITGSGEITYAPAYSNWSSAFPDAILKKPEVQKYTVNVSSSNSEQGTVSVTSEGQDINGTEVEDGTQITITAVPASGYIFTGFKDGNGNVVSTQPSYTTTVNGPINLTASFKLFVPSGEYVNGLLGEYYDSSELTNDSALRMRRIDDMIAYNFGYGSSPAPVIEPESFAIRWTGFIRPTVTGDYTFKTYSDDGVRVNVNGQQVIDNWGGLSLAYTVASNAIHLEAGNYYPITVEYQQLPLYAAVFLFWETNGVSMSLVPESAYFVSLTDFNTYSSPQYYNPIQGNGTGFINKFYNSKADFEDETDALLTERNNVNYTWGAGVPWLKSERPDGSIYYNQDDTDVFYGIMQGYLEARFSESTTLLFTVDDGIRVWIDDQPVISEWGWHNVETFEYSFNTEVGEKYKIRIEYIDKGLGASCVMGWRSDALGKAQPIESKFMYSD